MLPEEMAAAWRASSMYAASVATPEGMNPIALETDFAKAQYGKPFPHSGARHLASLVSRQFKLMGRNKLFLGFRTFSAVFMAIVFGALFYQGGVESGLNFFGLFLNAGMHVAFANISEMSSAVSDKYIAFRHDANGTHPSWAYPLAAIIAHLPLAMVESVAFCAISYFMCGLTAEAGRFFFFTLVVFMMDIFASILFRTFAYSAPTLITAQAGPMPIIALLILFAGFMVTPGKMPPALAWLYYVDIFGWAIRSLAQNEFFADRYNFVPPGGVATLGETYLKFFEMETDPAYKWAGIGFAAGAIVLVAIWSFWAFATIRFDRNVGSARHHHHHHHPASQPATAAEGEKQQQQSSAASSAAVAPTPASSSSSSSPGSDDSSSSPDTISSPVDPVLSPSSAAGVTPSSSAVNLAALEAGGASASVAVAVKKVDARSVLPFQPMTVAFEDIRYTVNLPPHMGGGSKMLLQGITGYALPGRMIALMGASGAGKTTLLDVLASRKNSGLMEGRIFLNGHPKEEETFNRVAAYVEQNDIHAPLTTVREALDFSASLRLPDGVTEAQRSAFVDEIMELLELTPIADRKVGDVGNADGLAPGERKRLTIGVELASNSPILFLDEPTSGLDARAAAVVMRVVKNVASTGRTVICTIHQPSSELFFMFDDLLLLQRGGWQVYFGPLGARGSELVRYLQALPGARPWPKRQNPASWMLDVLGGTDSSGMGGAAESGGSQVAPAAKIIAGPELQSTFFESTVWKGATDVMGNLCKDSADRPKVSFPSKRARSFFHQYLVLLGRQHRNYMRNIPFNVGRLGALIFLSILFGVIWYAIGERATDIGGVQSFVAAIFMAVTFVAMIQMDTSMPVLIRTRPVFYRETASYLYDSFAHSLSMITVEIPWVCAIIITVLPITYYMFGLVGSAFYPAASSAAAASSFFFHYLVGIVQAFVFISLGQFIASAAPSFDVAQACIGTLAPIMFLFGGMFSPPSKMPPGSRWVNTIDPVGYAFRAVVPPQFYCEGGAAAGCPQITIFDPSVGIVSVDRFSYVEKLYDFSYADRWAQVGYLAIFVLVFQVLAISATRYIRHIVR